MYQQSLIKVLNNYVKPKVLARNNRYKKWKYGYNKEHDIIVISKTGEIGEIYEIQNLKIALPKTPQKPHKFNNDSWQVTEYPKDLQIINTIFDWKNYPADFSSLLMNQSSVMRLTAEAILEKAKSKALKALLADPVVDNVAAAEKLLNNMIELQEEHLGYLN